MAQRTTFKCDVVVVGSGLSGLICARDLARTGLSVHVVEARPEFGGRCWREEIVPGVWVDNGGQWLGRTQDAFRQVLNEYGIKTFPVLTEGKSVLIWRGQRYEWDGSPFFGMSNNCAPPPNLPVEYVNDCLQAYEKLQKIIDSFPKGSHHPGESPMADDLDVETAETWIRREMSTDFGKWYFRYLVRSLGPSGPAEPGEMSMLSFAWGQFTGSQLEDPEAELIDGAAGQLPKIIVEKDIGVDCVHVDMPVEAIVHNDSGVEVYTLKNEAVFQAKYAVLAMPPLHAGRIEFSPHLTGPRTQFGHHYPMGTCCKVFLAVSPPFWRDGSTTRLNGNGMGDLEWVEQAADASNPNTLSACKSGTKGAGVGILVGFVVGYRYRRWSMKSPEEREKLVVGDFAKFYGDQVKDKYIAYHEVDWPKQAFVEGGYGGYGAPGAWSMYKEMATNDRSVRDGQIIYAGTEISCRWPGFFDGAIRSGANAASIITSELQGSRPSKSRKTA
mmetsp:Transcript_6194/g.9638  ORF Transcript_6194/g.9638 Transcript_6194/m.9638 type:complete len:498 (+) Transcript_6194:128-1621(+)